jgi:hypothetical protein
MTAKEIIEGRIMDWQDRVAARYPDAAILWGDDKTTGPNAARRIVLACKSMTDRDECVGYFVIRVSWKRIEIEESAVLNTPTKGDDLPTFSLRELFKASAAGAMAVVGAQFKGGSEIVKHYMSSEEFNNTFGYK